MLAGNQGLVSLLAAVSFLRLITRPGGDSEAPPRGRKALWRTLIGVHLFGAVINLSTVVILGDRMASRGRLGKRRALALSRGFAAAAFWSPFFSAMAAALTYAPGAQLSLVVLAGLPMAALSLWLTAREIDPEDATRGAPFIGYPMHFGALWIPGLLVVIVLVLHTLMPGWSNLAIITLSAPLLTVAILIVQQGRAAAPGRSLPRPVTAPMHPTYFRNLADFGRLPWFSSFEDRVVLKNKGLGPILDVHTHIALAYVRPMQVDLDKHWDRTEHYLPSCCPVDLVPYSNRNFTKEHLRELKTDLAARSIGPTGMRRTHAIPNLMREMEELGISHSVLLPIDFPVLSHNATYALDAQDKTRGTLLSFGSVHPYSHDVEGKLAEQVRRGARRMLSSTYWTTRAKQRACASGSPWMLP